MPQRTLDERLAAAVERRKRNQRALIALGIVVSVLVSVAAIVFITNRVNEQRNRADLLQRLENPSTETRPETVRPIENVPTLAESIAQSRREQDEAQEPAEPEEQAVAESESPGETVPSELERVRATINQIRQAESVEDQLKWLRHPDVIETTYRRYLEEEGKPLAIRAVTDVRSLPLIQGDFVLANAIGSTGKVVQAVLEDVGDRFLLDWESLVHFDPVSWQEFRQPDRPETAEFRLLAALSDNYDGPFNAEDHVCIRLRHPSEEGLLYGYFERDHPKLGDLRQKLSESGADSLPVFVRLGSPGPEGRPLQVIIEDILGEGWIRL